jgi:hypothetical protein
MGKAVSSALAQWESLEVYLKEVGRLTASRARPNGKRRSEGIAGRPVYKVKPFLLELYPSPSDELAKGPFSELHFRDNTSRAPSDSIESNVQGYNSTCPKGDSRFNTHEWAPAKEYRLRLKRP